MQVLNQALNDLMLKIFLMPNYYGAIREFLLSGTLGGVSVKMVSVEPLVVLLDNITAIVVTSLGEKQTGSLSLKFYDIKKSANDVGLETFYQTKVIVRFEKFYAETTLGEFFKVCEMGLSRGQKE